MNRITKNILSALFAVVLILSAFPIFSMAGEDVLFTLEERRNMAITVAYENDPPEIKFIAPNGDEYGAEAIADGKMSLYDSGSVLYFQIPDAEPGEWKIVYDKKNNSKIEVDCAPYVEAMSIDSFTYEKSDRESRLNTKFTVSYGESDDYFNYVIWAVVAEDGFVTGKTKLREGSARIGKENEVSVDLNSLSTYSEYKLMLEVYMESYGTEVFDTFISETSFSYTNPDTPEPIEDFKVEIGVTDNYIRLDWEEYAVYCDSYIVVIRAEGKDEPVYTAELSYNEKSTEVLVDLSVPSVTCEIAYKNGNRPVSQYASKKIDLSHGSMLSFVCDEVTSAAEGKVEYDFTAYGNPVRTLISINDETEEVMPEGSGSFSVKLNEYENDVKITWFETDTLCFTVSKEVYSDRKAPMLKLYEMTDTVVTEADTFILTGTTTPGCTVTVGDTGAQVDENGFFTVTLNLVNGINEFTVTATSKTGNSTKQVISIEKPAVIINSGNSSFLSSLLSYIPLILSFLFAAIICVFAFINTKVYSKKKDEIGKKRAVTVSVRNVFIFIASIALICAAFFAFMTVKCSLKLNSTEFLNTAYNSVTKAYELIEVRNAWLLSMIIAFGVLILSVATAIVCGIFSSEKHAEAVKRAKETAAAKKADAAKKSAIAKETKLNATSAIQPKSQDEPKCPNCGAKIIPEKQFCGQCGHKLK